MFIVGLLAAGCTGGEAEKTSASVPRLDTESVSGLEIVGADPVTTDSGFLRRTEEGLVLFRHQGETVCRQVVATRTERCLADKRLAEADIKPLAASDWKLIVREPSLGEWEPGLLINFESNSVVEFDRSAGAARAISPTGDRVLRLDPFESGQVFVENLDGSSTFAIDHPGPFVWGVWPEDDQVWLSGGDTEIVTLEPERGADFDEAVIIGTEPVSASWFLQTHADLGVAFVWDWDLVTNLEFQNATWMVDFDHEQFVPFPGPVDGLLVGLGAFAGADADAELLVFSIWDDGSEDRSDIAMYMTAVDRETGTAGEPQVIYRFNLSRPLEQTMDEMAAFPLEPYQILMTADGSLMWFTGSAIMEAKIS